MNDAIDQSVRDRFCAEIDRNFSVVAAAGSGKTRAITDRIVAIARHSPELLPDLVVVTFTNRAADEMQHRARQLILAAGLDVDVIARFNRAFFGTIHSFCLRLISEHGYRLGLPPAFDLVTDDDELWNDFVQRQTTIGNSLTPANRAMLLRHVQVRQLMELGRRGDIEARDSFESEPCPEIDVSPLLAFAPDGRSSEKIADLQASIREWDDARPTGSGFLPMPRCTSQAKQFVEIWRNTFRPLREWLNCGSLTVAGEVHRAYRDFRLERGSLTYADQIALAHELVLHPDTARRIRARNYRVILDEAQDTDPRQFSVLLEIARPPSAIGEWPDVAALPPRAGHFCMVGDFQQAIFGDRADLAQYRRIHDALVNSETADSLTFSVSFRLDRAEIELINATFREILHGRNDQVSFVELSPRPDVLPGQVIRLDLKPAELGAANRKFPERRKAAAIAAELATWIAGAGLKNLRAQRWRDVAILCPRRDWLLTLRDALREAGLAFEVQSETDLKGDNPAYAWLTALLQIVANPFSGYEIVGVLREVFGLSDHDLAVFADGRGERFQIARLTRGENEIAKKLTLLAKTRAEAAVLPLFDAVQLIVAKTQLRERLRLLGDVYDDLEAELDALLVAAANAEARQMTFANFARSLRLNFEARREVRATQRDAIQLITTQKAKGSEWQAVIVPFLSRRIRNRSREYPAVIRNAATGERFVVLDSEDVSPEAKQAIDQAERQEMERTLYVALTRAKHTLVLASEADAFHDARGKLQKASQMKWLRCGRGECNEATFSKLRAEGEDCAETRLSHASSAAGYADARRVVSLPPLGRDTMAVARAAAGRFVRKINPSGLSESVSTIESLDDDSDPATIVHSTFDNAA
ncbi:MAG: UvrD-helicase domain-containing protein, partial [Verrucomicrobiota bacterium]|nr:UvrD-helicase domain-containing protein [Verrucomicrobiota bacterium]